MWEGRGHFRPSSTCPQAPIPSLLNYLLMSSFASRRFSNGWRNGFVVSGAPLIAIVISLAAVGKSPVFDEIRASARWLTQWYASLFGTMGYSSNARLAFPWRCRPRAYVYS